MKKDIFHADRNLSAEQRRFSSGARGSYIALTTFLILSAVILMAGTTLVLLSIFQAQQGLARERGYQALYLAEGCVADALLSAFYDSGYTGGSETLPEGSCTISVSKVGNNWVITSTATVAGGYTRRVRVNILRSGTIQVLSWKEIE